MWEDNPRILCDVAAGREGAGVSRLAERGCSLFKHVCMLKSTASY